MKNFLRNMWWGEEMKEVLVTVNQEGIFSVYTYIHTHTHIYMRMHTCAQTHVGRKGGDSLTMRFVEEVMENCFFRA
jgi:hypothetical protein